MLFTDEIVPFVYVSKYGFTCKLIPPVAGDGGLEGNTKKGGSLEDLVATENSFGK